ncbi:MAG: hypothetical protein R2793_06375 [Flavobacteriaceae bacterium]
MIGQQMEEWFYLVAKTETFSPQFETKEEWVNYVGDDEKLKRVLEKYHITSFKKTQKKASKKNLNKTFFVIANDAQLIEDLLRETPHLFVSGELVPRDDRKIFEPNDYGLTSTIGENLGAQVNLDYLDFLGVPKAWYYTTGSKEVIIGISDGSIDTNDIEFKGKSKIIRSSKLLKGHGYSVSETAGGKGNNAYAIAGICYDCTLYATPYGEFKTYDQLMELSSLGPRSSIVVGVCSVILPRKKPQITMFKWRSHCCCWAQRFFQKLKAISFTIQHPMIMLLRCHLQCIVMKSQLIISK